MSLPCETKSDLCSSTFFLFLFLLSLSFLSSSFSLFYFILLLFFSLSLFLSLYLFLHRSSPSISVGTENKGKWLGLFYFGGHRWVIHITTLGVSHTTIWSLLIHISQSYTLNMCPFFYYTLT